MLLPFLFPCFGFLLWMFIVFGFMTLFAAADVRAAKNAPLAYAVSFAGSGMLGSFFLLASLETPESNLIEIFAAIGVLVVGVVGAALGYRAGVRRREYAEHQLNLTNHEDEETESEATQHQPR